MNIPRIVLAAFLALGLNIVIHNIAQYGLFPAAFDAYFALMPAREVPMFTLGVGRVLMALMLAIIFAAGYEARGPMEGARFGAVMALFFLGQDLVFHGAMKVAFAVMLPVMLTKVAAYLAMGVAMALVYRPPEPAPAGAAPRPRRPIPGDPEVRRKRAEEAARKAREEAGEE